MPCPCDTQVGWQYDTRTNLIRCFKCNSKFKHVFTYLCLECKTETEEIVLCNDGQGSYCQVCKKRGTCIAREEFVDVEPRLTYSNFLASHRD